VLGFSASLFWIEDSNVTVAAMCNVGTVHSGDRAKGIFLFVKSREFLEIVLDLVRN
jgi:hypothetical protein